MPHSLRSFSHRSRSPLQVAILEEKETLHIAARKHAYRIITCYAVRSQHAAFPGDSTDSTAHKAESLRGAATFFGEVGFCHMLIRSFSFNLLIVIIIALFWSCPCVIHLWRPVAWFQCFANVFDRSLNADGICGIFWVCPVWPWTRRLQFACLEVGRSWILL